MTRVPLIFGTMTLGEAGRNGVRESDLPRCRERDVGGHARSCTG
jgi:hypothetical protein